MPYGDNEDKQEGIIREAEIAENFEKYLKSKGFIVKKEKASDFQNMFEKIDYIFEFDPSSPFLDLTTVRIDIKARNSYTIYDNLGRNAFAASKADFLLKNLKDSDEYMLIIVAMLKECVEKNPPRLLPGKNDNSKYFWLNTYIEQNKEFFKNYVKVFNYKVE
jgi:hypothetical protein